MILIIFSLLIVVLVEAFFDVQKIRAGISPPVSWAFRLCVGAAYLVWYYFKYDVYPLWILEELGLWSLFLVSFYWTFFDMTVNVMRGKNALVWGQTKVIDRFFGGRYLTGWYAAAMPGVGHLIKWSLLLTGFFSVCLPRIQGETPVFYPF